jgi:hypothetical protein
MQLWWGVEEADVGGDWRGGDSDAVVVVGGGGVVMQLWGGKVGGG